MQTVTHFFEGGEARIMGSGSLRELLVLEKIAFGGVYVTDPVVPTFSGPQLTARCRKCAAVGITLQKIILTIAQCKLQDRVDDIYAI